MNSVVADEEILNACVSILTYILTSNQLLSVNRTFDTKAQEQIVENKNRKNFRVAAEEIVKVFKENNFSLFPVISTTPYYQESATNMPNVVITPLVTSAPSGNTWNGNTWNDSIHYSKYTDSSDSAGNNHNSNRKD